MGMRKVFPVVLHANFQRTNSMSSKERIDTSGNKQSSLGPSPFEALNGLKLPEAPRMESGPAKLGQAASKATRLPNKGRCEVRRETSGRNGKTVTTIKGMMGLSPSELEVLGRELRNFCGAGGTVAEGVIEVQGDHRQQVIFFLEKQGFKPVAAGG